MTATDSGSADDILDAHLHLWDLSTGDYTWNTADLGPVHRSFSPDDAARALTSAGVGRAVLVQAADTAGDSERMFRAAAEHPWVAGVVAWIPLDDPPRARTLLDRWAATRRLCGVRQLLHDHADPHLLDAPDVRTTLSELAARGLPLDIPDAWPRLWPATVRLVEAMPELTVVLDHLGKPQLDLGNGRLDPTELRRWADDLRRLGDHPSVVAKLSGLDDAFRPGTLPDARAITPLLEAALASFGADRLMFGGDWPVSSRSRPYRATVLEMQTALDRLDLPDPAAVWTKTAQRVYRLTV